MDQATVEDDFEQDEILSNSEDIHNKDPFILTAVVSSIGSFLQVYGWYVLIVAGIAYYFYCKYRSKIHSLFDRSPSDDSLHRYDDDEVRRRHEDMEEARRRLQEKYSAEAMRHKEEEAAKRRERILNNQGKGKEDKGYRIRDENKSNPPPENRPATGQSKKTYRPDDYNPLSGGSSSTSYRPPARRGGGGG